MAVAVKGTWGMQGWGRSCPPRMCINGLSDFQLEEFGLTTSFKQECGIRLCLEKDHPRGKVDNELGDGWP